MKKNTFKNILIKSISQEALKYLLNKRGSKGKEIEYSSVRMAEYLLPQDENLSIEDQQNISSIRNRMVEIEDNFRKRQSENICKCGKRENMQHIYDCKYLNSEDSIIRYEEIFGENVKNQKTVLERFRRNLDSRVHHGIPYEVDPLYCYDTVMEIK